MKCPECGKELIAPTVAVLNMESYGRPVTARTECCKKLVRLYPKVSFSAEKYKGRETKDDWGN